ncbi:S1 family peptidase [Schlesneria paludicola]|uniref:S1 family peptidase n=1 Tax=Schlesneria paludicola TaxID=360056 RepID=UPI00058ACDDE|nr:serine protease [Schlesneria paludicola]
MKYLAMALVCIVLGIVVSINLRMDRDFRMVSAQEAREQNPQPGPLRMVDSRAGMLGQSEGRSYPAYLIDEIVLRLTTSAEEMIQQKRTKNSEELRKNLDRTGHTVKLAPASSTELPTDELYRQASQCVYLVAGLTRPKDEMSDWKTAFSTAFALHSDGILSTSAHVFDHNDHDDVVVVMDIRGNVYPVTEILAMNKLADTALFRIEAKGLKTLALGKDLAPGSPVRVIGHPGDSFFFFSAGHLANYERDDEGAFWLNITADFGQGSSGGPVMDVAGNVVGQVSRTYTLYASGDTSNRPRRIRSQNPPDANVADAAQVEATEVVVEVKKKSDPQMVFKACTPVSAIRALVK